MLVNLPKIKEDFDKVIKYSQGIPEPKTQELLETWRTAKKFFIDKWGSPIYELPEKLTLHLNEKERHEKVMSFCNYLINTFGFYDLNDFIIEQEDGFFDNITIKDFEYEGHVIKKGSKLVRTFKHFIKNPICLTDVQNMASRYIQEDKIEGTMCFSVHPLDFLSVSENTHNWRSCHALDGEYRAGNLSYMMDKCTFIAYLKSNTDVKLNNFPDDVPWNSKKWRVLLYLSTDGTMMFAGKQYPFTSMEALNTALDELKRQTLPVGSHDDWTDWNNKYIKTSSVGNIKFNFPQYVPIASGLKRLDELVIEAEGSRQFNDVLKSSCYTNPFYTFKYKSGWWGSAYPINEDPKFIIGGKTLCLRCGKEEILHGADTMMCSDCELKYGNSDNDLFTYCECCGSRHYTDDMYYTVAGDYICAHCMDNYYHVCDNCNGVEHIDYIHYDAATDKYYCEECWQINEQVKKIKEEKINKKTIYIEDEFFPF